MTSCDELTERHGEHHPSVVTASRRARDRRTRAIEHLVDDRGALRRRAHRGGSGLVARGATRPRRVPERPPPAAHRRAQPPPSRHRSPLVVGLIEELVHATYDRHERGRPAAAGPGRTGQRRSPATAGEHRLRGRRPRGPHARLPAGSQPGPQPLGHLGRGFPLALSDHRGPAGHRRSTDPRDAAPPRRSTSYPTRPSSATARASVAGHSTSWVERDRLSMSDLAQAARATRSVWTRANQLKWVELTPAHSRPALSRLPGTSLGSSASSSRER